jgi:hypothetical protein
MNNQFYPSNYKHKLAKGESNINDAGRSGYKEFPKKREDDDLIIEENTIYEIDRECVERLKRNKKR